MKKIFAIAMLAAYLFNLAGYNIFFNYSIQKATQQIVNRLDRNQYNEKDLFELKIKLNLPYISDWGDYERLEGEIEFQGVHYDYVKRKVSQDTLYLLCLPSQPKTDLYKGKNNYLVNVNDIPAGKETKNTPSKKNIAIDEFRLKVIDYDLARIGQTSHVCNHFLSSPIRSCYLSSPAQPPEINS